MEVNVQHILGGDQGIYKALFASAVQPIYQEAINIEFNKFIGVKLYGRGEYTNGYRNGYYDRWLETCCGKISLKIPRARTGKFRASIFWRYQRAEPQIIKSLCLAYINGTSTRVAGEILENMCGKKFSKNVVSGYAQLIDGELEKWRTRKLDKKYLYLIFDARYDCVVENGRVVKKAFLIVIGIAEDGTREIIGCMVGDSEAAEVWEGFFQSLIDRGLSGVIYMVSDDHAGIKKAIATKFPGIDWQRCQVHFIRNFTDKFGDTEVAKEYLKLLNVAFHAPEKELNKEQLENAELCKDVVRKHIKILVADLRNNHRNSIAKWLEENIEETLQVYNLPAAHRKQMKSSNMLERFNQELKRRSKVVRIFPNDAAYFRLLGARCMRQSNKWKGKVYIHFADNNESAEHLRKCFSP